MVAISDCFVAHTRCNKALALHKAFEIVGRRCARLQSVARKTIQPKSLHLTLTDIPMYRRLTVDATMSPMFLNMGCM